MRKAFFYLGLSVIPVLALTLAQAPLLSIQNDFQQVRQLYKLALDATRLELSELSHTLRAEPLLAQNLGTEGLSAVGRSLTGYIKPGAVAYLAVVDAGCHIVAHSEQGMPLTETCPIDNFKAQSAPHFQWRQVGGTPRLEFITPLGDTHTLLLASALNDTWIASHPELRQAFRVRDIRLGGPAGEGVLVAEEGIDAAQAPIANLYSSDPWAQLLPQLLKGKSISLEKPLIVALLLFLASLLYLVRDYRRRDKEIAGAHRLLAAWAHDLAPGETKEASSPLALVQSVQERLTKLAKTNFEQIQRFQHQNHLLQQQTVSLESRLMEHQAEQAWFQQVRSLHQQMMACASAHMDKLNEAHSLGEDLSHLASHQLVKPAQKLFDLSSRWEMELQEMSSRKFVRSLSERVDADGASELDQSLAFIIEQSHDLNNSAINLTLLTQRLLADLRSNLQLAEHWHQMMGGHESNKHSLLTQLTKGQSLIQLQDAGLSLNYENQVESEIELSHLGIPSSTFTSAIYHCYLALIEAARSKGASDVHLITQLKKRGERAILVLSAKGDWLDEWSEGTQLPPKADQHLYLAIQLMQGHALKIGQLPGLHGAQAITLMWDTTVRKTGDLALIPTLSL